MLELNKKYENKLVEVILNDGQSLCGIMKFIDDENFELCGALKSIAGPMPDANGNVKYVTTFIPVRAVGDSVNLEINKDNVASIGRVKEQNYIDMYNKNLIDYDSMFTGNGKVKEKK